MAAKRKKKAETPDKEESHDSKQLGLFDVLNNVNGGTTVPHLFLDCPAEPSENDLGDGKIKSYNAFMINRGLSYFPDTVFFANEMNQAASLPPRMQYDFLRNSIRPRKRFSKWFSASGTNWPYDEVVMEHYKCNSRRAAEIIAMLPEDKLKDLMDKYDRGGKSPKDK